MAHFEKKHRITKKPGAGIVTEADKEAEAYVVREILKNFPNSSIIAEESGEARAKGDFCWIIDPLDGTSNYAHGFPVFCVSVGVYHLGHPFAGIVFQPYFEEFFFAQKGKGAFLNGRRIRVSKTQKLEDALLGTGFYYSKGKELREEMVYFVDFNERCLAVRRPGSAALDLAYVASGRYDGFWERGLSPWDVAAGFLLVEEAGGKITDYQGRATDIFKRQTVASNSRLHPTMMKIMKGT